MGLHDRFRPLLPGPGYRGRLKCTLVQSCGVALAGCGGMSEGGQSEGECNRAPETVACLHRCAFWSMSVFGEGGGRKAGASGGIVTPPGPGFGCDILGFIQTPKGPALSSMLGPRQGLC